MSEDFRRLLTPNCGVLADVLRLPVGPQPEPEPCPLTGYARVGFDAGPRIQRSLRSGRIRIFRRAHVRVFQSGKRGKHTMLVCRYCGTHRIRSSHHPMRDAMRFLNEHRKCDRFGNRLPARRGRQSLLEFLEIEFRSIANTLSSQAMNA